MAKESKRMTLKVGSILVVHELWDYNVDGELHYRGCGVMRLEVMRDGE